MIKKVESISTRLTLTREMKQKDTLRRIEKAKVKTLVFE